MKKTVLLLIITLFAFSFSMANSNVTGKWRTIDDNTGEVKSIVEITKKDGKLYGKIIQLFNEDPNYDPLCTECKGKLKNKKILGMQIIKGLEFKDDRWVGDDGILDPDNGKIYDVKIWVDEENDNKLNVRGYIAFLYRTQTWVREIEK
ncbi:MAG: DUF2147 domain-containing protein [Prolixibacteraceae bacterium]|jgi:uncharacterized protein (DUF2147 family)|nr:DUF2147 domain-containing protein [Prolixibacteraceae bacterium]